MEHKNKSKSFKILLAAVTLNSAFVLAGTSSAVAGGVSDGGGNAVGNTLLDFYESDASDNVEITNTSAYVNRVAPLLDKLELSMPSLSSELRSRLSNKKWFFESRPLSGSCLNSSGLVEVDAQIVACQDREEIRLYRPWWELADEANQGGLIMHELLVSLMLDSSGKTSESEVQVRKINRLLHVEGEIDVPEIRERLMNYKMGFFIVLEEANKITNRMKEIVPPARCTKLNDLAKRYMALLPYSIGKEELNLDKIFQGYEGELIRRIRSLYFNSMNKVMENNFYDVLNQVPGARSKFCASYANFFENQIKQMRTLK